MSEFKEIQVDLDKIYNDENENIKIERTNFLNRKACIYFSSNGLYYPNTKKEFEEKIIKNNFYEWERNKLKRIEKNIFVRDIYKGWYLLGINKKINSPEKLIEFLREETRGYEIVTVGVSSGGYAAVLYGSLLKADKIFSFNGQFNLERLMNNDEVLKKNPVLSIIKGNKDKWKYLNIIKNIRENNVYYFMSKNSQEDYENYMEILKEKLKIKVFKFNSKDHGIPIFLPTFKYLIKMKKQKIDNLKDKENKYLFALKVMGVFNFLFEMIGFVFYKITKKLRGY